MLRLATLKKSNGARSIMRLVGRLVDVAELTAVDRRKMVELMERYYQGVVRDAFERDLAEKQWIVQLNCASTGELRGFSTQMVLEVAAEGRSIKALFSGDTIIDRQYWGDRALFHHTWQLALSLVDQWPSAELYWFLISQGYKTYLLLPLFFREFYPRYDCPTPADIQSAIAMLATSKFSDRYDRESGVIRSDSSQYRLRDGVAEITAERRRNPHVRFFVERNPLHAQGDELCCVARLSPPNFTRAMHRVLRATAPRK